MNIENSGNILKPQPPVPVTGSELAKQKDQSQAQPGKVEREANTNVLKSSLVLKQLKPPALGARGDLLTQVKAKLQSGEIVSRSSAESAANAILDT